MENRQLISVEFGGFEAAGYDCNPFKSDMSWVI